MNQLTQMLQSAGFDLSLFWKAALILSAGTLVLGLAGRVLFGRRSSLNHAVSSAIGILFIYALSIVLSVCTTYTKALAPLPFVQISGEQLTVFSFAGAGYQAICRHVLSMVILAFLVNLMDCWLPKGKNLFSWLFFRCLTVILGLALHLAVAWALQRFLPAQIMDHAPVILLGVLVILLLTGALKLLVGAVLTTVNPVIAALYTFFFATLVGRQLSKAVLTTAILAALVYALNQLGLVVICIAQAALVAYLPLLLVLLALWYIVGHLL